jgi:hypothetical protein
MFKALETQGSIGNHLLCAPQKNLRVFVYETWSLPLERWYMSAINESIMLTFLPPVSCLYTTRDGSTAEMALPGNDGTIGIASFLGYGTIPHRAVAQIGAHALKIPAKALQDVTT